MNRLEQKDRRRLRRKRHIRKTIAGTTERPRLSVFRSNRHMYVQVIDDEKRSTVVAASSIEADLRSLGNRVADAAKLGEVVGKRLKEKKVGTVVFDRNGFAYHGIVKAIADGVRKAGIRF